MTQPVPNEAKFRVGNPVRVATLDELARLQAQPDFHHPLEPEQLESAGAVATVREISYYLGGEPLYRLENVPGTWPERCLTAP